MLFFWRKEIFKRDAGLLYNTRSKLVVNVHVSGIHKFEIIVLKLGVSWNYL